MGQSKLLEEWLGLMLERIVREADVSDGSRVAFGSDEHTRDLEVRIADLTRWRDRQKKGSESRANYSRLISRLRNELRSAKRSSVKGRKVNVAYNE